MSPAISCFSRVTSSTTLPVRTVTLVHLGSWRVADTTYLGRLFSRSAHSPGRDAHRSPNHSSLRRPSSKAVALSASACSTFAHSSRSLPLDRVNQPPRLKPSPPSGSWTTPSSDMFVLMTIFPIFGSPWCWCELAVDGGYTAARRNWATAHRPVRPARGVYTGRGCGTAREEGDRRGTGGFGPDCAGAGRGRRGVRRADRTAPARTAGALLPAARIVPGRRGHAPGHAAGRLARPGRVHRRTRLAAHVAVQDRHQPVPQRAPLRPPSPGKGVGCAQRGAARADPAR